MKCHRISITLLVALSTTNLTLTQEKNEPLFDELKSAFKKRYFNVSVLLQSAADVQMKRPGAEKNGFTINTLRLGVSGRLDGGIGYAFVNAFERIPAILDARLFYEHSPSLAVDLGLYKTAFSREFLLGEAVTDFVNRAQFVRAMVPPRQIGVQARGWIVGNVFSYAAGVFNGNGYAPRGNDNNHFLYVGRLALYPSFAQIDEDHALEIAVNAGYSRDNNVSLGIYPNFAGTRTLVGGDFRFTRGNLLLSGEIVHARLEPFGVPKSLPYGYHATVGYMVTPSSQVLLRWDALHPNGLAPDSRLIVFGFNHWLSSVAEIHVNYIINREDTPPKHHRLLVQGQVAF